MQTRRILTLSAAALTLALTPAVAQATQVSVRVEGKTKTLLAATTVSTHTGSITTGGAPSGACPAASGQGALDVATRHRWAGPFSKDLGSYFIKTILGETDNGPKIYWSIFVNNISASTGACEIKLHRGDQLLFAAATYPEYPIALVVPRTAHVNQRVVGKVVAYNAKGVAKPLPGAIVSVNGHSGRTDSHGKVPLTPSRAGTYRLTASKTGYIRAATVTLKVTP